MATTKKRFVPPIPEGFQLFVQREYVAGCHHRRDAVQSLLNCRDPYLQLVAEPTNPHDRNAIRVIGCCKGWLKDRKFHVGYIPKDLAARIVSKNALRDIQPRLRMIECRDYVSIEFDLVGPKGQKKAFLSS